MLLPILPSMRLFSDNLQNTEKSPKAVRATDERSERQL